MVRRAEVAKGRLYGQDGRSFEGKAVIGVQVTKLSEAQDFSDINKDKE